MWFLRYLLLYVFLWLTGTSIVCFYNLFFANIILGLVLLFILPFGIMLMIYIQKDLKEQKRSLK